MQPLSVPAYSVLPPVQQLDGQHEFASEHYSHKLAMERQTQESCVGQEGMHFCHHQISISVADSEPYSNSVCLSACLQRHNASSVIVPVQLLVCTVHL